MITILAGQVADNPQQIQQLEDQDYLKCRNPRCDYWLAPEEWQAEEKNSYFSCPRCKMRYRLLDPTPFGNRPAEAYEDYYGEPGLGAFPENRPEERKALGETYVGLTMKQQGDIGEDLIQEQGEIPGYGPITWWSNEYNDPIDGGCGEWAIEVKTICIDIRNHRWVPGSPYRKEQMIHRAEELGFKGILGLLVIVDYRTSLADVYLMEMPLDPWITQERGRHHEVRGPVAYRKQNGQHLLEQIPFHNPFLDPNNPEPVVQQSDQIPF